MLKLIPGTLHVHSLNDYGAVEVGEHRFSRVEAGRRLVEARAGAELRSPLDPLNGLPGFQEQLTVADASAHDAATATWEGLPLELREKDAGVCCSGERGGAQVSLCSAPFTDSWRA
jgi:hypothetical protein